MAQLRPQWARQVKDAQVLAFGAPPIPGLSVAGGFKLMVEDRGGLGLPTLDRQTDNLVQQAAEAAVAGRRFHAVPLRPRRSSSWTSTGPRSRRWEFR